MNNSPSRKLFNKSKSTLVAEHVLEARTFRSRAIGLLGKTGLQPQTALWIAPCKSIHTWFMKFPIDVVFVDKNLKVHALYENLKPWRMTRLIWRAFSVLEMPVGSIASGRIEVGDELHVDS